MSSAARRPPEPSRQKVLRWLVLALLLVAPACGSDGPPRPEGASPATVDVAHAELPTPRALPDPGLAVFVLGDSVMYDAEAAIEAALESTGEVTVRSVAAFGQGFSDGADVDFEESFAALEQGPPADQVIVMVGSWDHFAVLRDAEGYADAVDRSLRLLSERGRAVLVLGEAPSDPAKGEEEARLALNRVLEDTAATLPNVTFLSTDPVVGDPEGRYLRFDGAELLRKPDGRHLCPAGAERFGRAVLHALADTWVLPPADPSWTQGAWRVDPRYDDPVGACAT